MVLFRASDGAYYDKAPSFLSIGNAVQDCAQAA